MRLKLVTDNDRVHALVTEKGEIVTGVSDVKLEYGRDVGPRGKRATVVLTKLDVEVVETEHVPRLRPEGRRS